MSLKTLTGVLAYAMVSVTVAIVIAFAPSEVTAQGRTPYTPIKLYDKNGDGKISPNEWPKNNFKLVDKNKDGFLTPDDFAKHWGVPLPRKGAARKGGGGPGPAAAKASEYLDFPDDHPLGRGLGWLRGIEPPTPRSTI